MAGIADINCALGQPAVASTNTSTAHLVNDGNPATRWGSSYANNQWIYIDRGQSRDIHRVVLKWETAYASGYRLEVSNDASNWTQILTMSNGQSCVEDLGNLTGSGRYVHLYCVQASRVGAIPWGKRKARREQPPCFAHELHQSNVATISGSAIAPGRSFKKTRLFLRPQWRQSGLDFRRRTLDTRNFPTFGNGRIYLPDLVYHQKPRRLFSGKSKIPVCVR